MNEDSYFLIKIGYCPAIATLVEAIPFAFLFLNKIIYRLEGWTGTKFLSTKLFSLEDIILCAGQVENVFFCASSIMKGNYIICIEPKGGRVNHLIHPFNPPVSIIII